MRRFPFESARLVTLVIAGCLLAGATAGWAGTVTGTIKYEGRSPAFKPLQMGADPLCAAKHTAAVMPELVVLGPNNALANVFVYVKSGLPADKKWDPPAQPVVMDQKGCTYRPHVMGVMVGQKFKILNSDNLLHNVHSLSAVNSQFNRAMPGNVHEAEYTFTKEEGMFKVKCDVHPWMGAFVGVMKHPFFAITGSDGKFKIDNLPAGTYTIEAWHEFDKFPAQTVTVTIAGTESKTADFTFKGPSS